MCFHILSSCQVAGHFGNFSLLKLAWMTPRRDIYSICSDFNRLETNFSVMSPEITMKHWILWCHDLSSNKCHGKCVQNPSDLCESVPCQLSFFLPEKLWHLIQQLGAACQVEASGHSTDEVWWASPASEPCWICMVFFSRGALYCTCKVSVILMTCFQVWHKCMIWGLLRIC